jgi:very-short-patch-repair endonuclease
MNRWVGRKRLVCEPLPEAPWPVAARGLLTKREQSLYRILLNLYPEHKIFVQVALSQLIDVERNHPERHSIRARYKQLVADFVLCRPDLAVVAVIELDDRTHAWPKRKAADARKNKALADAGIRLVRIPAGRLPAEDTLRALIDADAVARDGPQEETVLSLAERVETFSAESANRWRDDSSAETRELKRIALKAIAVGILFVGGWIIFSQVLPIAIEQAFQPLATRPVRASPARQQSLPVKLPQLPTVPVISPPSADALAEKKRDQMLAAAAEQKQKQLAWAAYYSAPASCEHPADWSGQVECGNQYMRAKKLFDQHWAAEHPSSQGSGAEVVLNNGSVGR